MPSRSCHPRVWFLVPLAVAVAVTPALGQSSSASYVLQQSTLNTGGDFGTSASYIGAGSLGQEATIGTSSSFHYVAQSGFWGFFGSGLVPVWLFANRNPVNRDNVDLNWTGNNSPYDVYQATGCTNVFGSYFGTTPANAMANIPPPVTTLVCYSVLATAPGPFESPVAP